MELHRGVPPWLVLVMLPARFVFALLTFALVTLVARLGI
jgi:hypothetical protein